MATIPTTVCIGIIRPRAYLHASRRLNEDYRKFYLVQRARHFYISFVHAASDIFNNISIHDEAGL